MEKHHGRNGKINMSELLDFYKGKKVLVTGHTGFKGSWLCRILVQAGADVTGYSLEAPTNPNLFELADVEEQMNSVIGDIRDRKHIVPHPLCGTPPGNDCQQYCGKAQQHQNYFLRVCGFWF